MESIVAEGMIVRELKYKLVQEAREQGIKFPFQVNRYIMVTVNQY